MAEGKRTLPSTILADVSMQSEECREFGDALLVDLHGVLVPEGRLADEELVN
jgi:hypothetical protein